MSIVPQWPPFVKNARSEVQMHPTIELHDMVTRRLQTNYQVERDLAGNPVVPYDKITFSTSEITFWQAGIEVWSFAAPRGLHPGELWTLIGIDGCVSARMTD